MLAKAARNALRKHARLPSRLRLDAKREAPHLFCRAATATATVPLPASRDDSDIIVLFDQPNVAQWAASSSSTGLFGHPVLTSPSAFNALPTLLSGARIARESREELFKVVKNLDRLSDLLCGVIDLAELIRNAHPDKAWVRSADEVYEQLCEFMNVLNTHVGLYEVLHMQRDRFVSLSTEILLLGRQFLNETATARAPAVIKPEELQGLKDMGMGARLRLQAQMIMRAAPAEEPRRKVYMAANASSPEQVEVLEKLLRARGELARLVGKSSFAHMTLGDKMAKSPENVQRFLDALLDHTRPYARSALRTLSVRKQAHLHTPPYPTIQLGQDYYCPPEPPAPPVALPPLTLGTVFMGISLRLADVTPGEVVDEDSGVLGKPSGAAHYTVRCSRRVDDDDYDKAAMQTSRVFEAAHRRQFSGQEGTFQLPVVVLLCEFARPTVGRGPTVLEWHEVMTLFHEMGHAMHSMIGRTEYQNVSGTRCATDFVELPSILMEHFLNSPAVLSLFDPNGSLYIRQTGNHHEDPCRSIDTHTQILLASLDQIYHSPAVLDSQFNSTTALAKLYEMRGLIPYVPGTSWQTQFGHLFGYGATYYSYLFDRAIASRVWRKLFSLDPLNRETGERFKREVLRHGGGKDPWNMVSTLLDSPDLRAGDAEAMEKVGKWRIEDDVSLSGRH
ncbi:peptidase family M3-domain-containing protein [Fomitopsis serialis]|uniref:peptidase family M3-domain-containing protein n=1 Tax=Fomitopsis serialis TaxID=139415 RepID=UPI002008CF98|nr:peptidase family M3-domain-containing protein [Neoantrodia serialis]KAH9937291.1 peptidase family M3-domain-containing protein [Neoantrodia serialis]